MFRTCFFLKTRFFLKHQKKIFAPKIAFFMFPTDRSQKADTKKYLQKFSTSVKSWFYERFSVAKWVNIPVPAFSGRAARSDPGGPIFFQKNFFYESFKITWNGRKNYFLAKKNFFGVLKKTCFKKNEFEHVFLKAEWQFLAPKIFTPKLLIFSQKLSNLTVLTV